MTIREAAERLGVTPRTLQRYTKEGRIGARQEKGKTRSVTVYEEADVTALQATLESSPYAKRSQNTALATDTITVRLDEHYLTQLALEGAKRGYSAGQYARQLIIGGLEDRHSQELERLRKDVANATYATLAYGGKLTPEESEAWVRENLEHE